MIIHKLIPFLFFILLTVYLLFSFGTTSFTSELPFLLFGVFMWNVMEYGFHRFIFHNRALKSSVKKRVAHGHITHHRNPDKKDDLILPLTLTVPVSIVYFLVVAAFAGFGHASFAYAGIIGTYFIYEYMHYRAHHVPSKSGFFKYMQTYHLSHHQKYPNKRFMVTSPIFDYLFGTK